MTPEGRRALKQPINIIRMLLACGVLGGIVLCSLAIIAGELISTLGAR